MSDCDIDSDGVSEPLVDGLCVIDCVAEASVQLPLVTSLWVQVRATTPPHSAHDWQRAAPGTE